MKTFLGCVAVLALAAGNAGGQAPPAPGYFRQPAVEAGQVVFVSEGDLWRVPVEGGSAVRLTSNLAAESNPAISPDGRQVAFSARYEGPAEVYVMALEGGLPTRLTHDGDNAQVQGWTRDGRVLFASARHSGKPEQRLYTVHAGTREVTPLPLHEAAEGCFAGDTLYFTRQPQAGDNVKGYVGGQAQRIWRFRPGAEAVLVSGAQKGVSRQPMCVGERVYFLSDRDGTMNLWSMNGQGQDARQHTRHEGFDIRGARAAADGRHIAYQLGADIHVFDVAAGASRKLDIRLQSDFEHLRARWVKSPWDFVTALDASPAGDRIAITARGQVFVVPAGSGRRVEVTRNSDVRARNAVFSHDGRHVYAFADASGEMELTRYPANGVGEARQLTKNAPVLRLRAFPSPDGKWVAHHDKERRLYLLNLATGEDREIDRSRYDQFDNLEWSPDSRWLLAEKAAGNQFETLELIEVATGKRHLLTSDRYHSRSGAFSPDGKWLYFLSDRHLLSVVGSPWGQRNPEPFFDRQTRIYALALDPTAKWPFQPKNELQRAEPEKKDEKKEPDKKEPEKKEPEKTPQPAKRPDSEPAELKGAAGRAPAAAAAAGGGAPASGTPRGVLRIEGLAERLYEVPLAPGNYSRLSTDGKRLYFLVSEAAAERKFSLRSVAIEPPNPGPQGVIDNFFDDVRFYQLTQDRKKLFIRKANELWVFDAGKSPPPPAEQAKFAVNLRDWTFAVDPREEWRQMFVDAWRMHRDFFYDKNMHGADWKRVRARYEPLVARVADRAELNDLLAQMISEVSALHSQVGAADLRRAEDNIDVGALAADVVKTPAGFRVARLHGGDPELLEERSPLAQADVGVKPGDTLTAINGVPAATAASPGELLRNQVGKQVLVSLLEAGGRRRDAIVTPVSARRDRDLRYLSWENERRTRVDAAGKSRIGYVHLQAMGPADIARWAREFYPVFQRDGLIIDLRHNRGGSIDSWIIEKLQRRAWHFWKARSLDDPFSNQQVTFRGHVVALIDADTYSDGETMAQGLRRLGIAPLIGMTTAGAGIWLSDQNRLVDNGLARAAESGSFVDDGKERAWITEGTGVAPDMEVDNLPHATYHGADAQLDAAIRYLNEKIAKEPVRAPQVPPYPVLNRK